MPSIFLRHLDNESIIIERERVQNQSEWREPNVFVAAGVTSPMALSTVKLLVSILSCMILARYEKDNRE